jgi:hydroxypyruvate reductase
MNKSGIIDIFQSALGAADPYRAVMRHISLAGNLLSAGRVKYDLGKFKRIIVIGAGKGTAPMAQAAEALLGNRIDHGIIIVKYGHTKPLRTIILREAAHPLPDDAGMKATAEIRKLLREAGEDTLVLCLFSGGASSLLVAPIEGISLDEKRETTSVLLSAGVGINELNAVRKHLSAVKGGRLAETAYPAAVLALVLSDVIGDRMDVIASGPTVPDSTSFRDALAVIHKYSLEKKIPASVLSVLHMGVAGILPDTPKAGALFFQNTWNIVVGNIRQSLDAARTRAEEQGCGTELISADLQGEAREVAHMLAAKAITVRSSMRQGGQPCCLLFGGETTVTVKGKGTGGRNQELALAFAVEIAGIPGITLLSGGTDGTDGPTDAAGAMVDGETLPKSYAAGLDAAAYLENNDSYSFFSRLDTLTGGAHHIKTGPTGTNVMDLQIILIER